MFEGSFIYTKNTLYNIFKIVGFNFRGPNDSFFALNSFYQFFVALEVDCTLLHLLEDWISKFMIFARGYVSIVLQLETELAQLLLGRTSQLFFSLRQFCPEICKRCQQFFARFLVS